MPPQETLFVAVPLILFAVWVVAAPRAAIRFYAWLYPGRQHSRWYPHILRAAAAVFLVFLLLVLLGVLK